MATPAAAGQDVVGVGQPSAAQQLGFGGAEGFFLARPGW